MQILDMDVNDIIIVRDKHIFKNLKRTSMITTRPVYKYYERFFSDDIKVDKSWIIKRTQEDDKYKVIRVT